MFLLEEQNRLGARLVDTEPEHMITPVPYDTRYIPETKVFFDGPVESGDITATLMLFLTDDIQIKEVIAMIR